MKKKKIFGILIVLMSVLLLAACGGSGSESSPDTDTGNGSDSGTETDTGSDTDSATEPGSDEEMKTYKVATDANFQPFEYKNPETGEMEGFDIDLLRAIAEEAGFKVEFQTIQFDGLLAGLQSGTFPMGIAGISITDARDENIDFSDPYYDSGLIVMVEEGNTEIKSVEDLDGKTVGTRQGSTSQAYLKENVPGAEVKAFPAIVTAYMDLKNGRLDAVLYDLPNVKYFIKENGEGELKTVGDVLEGQSYGIGFPEGSDLVDDVNKALATIKENGTYDEIYKKWFGTAPPE